jgi:HlyD family secretion protein
VDGTIEIERLDDVLYVNRPAFGQPESSVSLFRLAPGTGHAVRTTVRLGRSSVNTIEVLEGLAEGDSVIISDVSRWDGFDRLKID